MELRNCSNTHFVHAIRGSSMVKVRNRDSNGRPALSSNRLKDVYVSNDAKILQKPPKVRSCNVQLGSVFDPEHVKCEVPCLPVVDGTLRQIKTETDEFIQYFDSGSDNVLDDETTLKQLKKRKLNRNDENCEVSCLPVGHGTRWELKPKADDIVRHSVNVSDNVLDDDTTSRKLKKRFLAKRRKLSHSYENPEVPFLPVADSIIGEVKPESDEFVQHSDTALDSDLDDETTLGHLKKKFLGKKRNLGCSIENSNMGCSNKNPSEDESQLKEFATNWKLMNSRKSMARRKCTKRSAVSSPTTASDIKPEPDLVSEWSPEEGGDLAPVIQVKVEAWDGEALLSQRRPTFADDSSISRNKVPHPGGEASNGSQKMTVQLEPKESLLSAEDCLNCVTNETSYDHLEDYEPTYAPVSSNTTSVKLETFELRCDESLDLPPLETHRGKEIREDHSCGSSPADDQNPDTCMLSRKISSMKKASEQYSSSVAQAKVPDMATESTTGCMELHPEDVFEEKSKDDFPREQGHSLGIPGKNHSSSQNFTTNLKTEDYAISIEDTKTGEEEPLTCTVDDIARSGLNCGSNRKNGFLTTGLKQSSDYLVTDTKCQSSLKNQTSNIADAILEDKLLETDGSMSLITDAESRSSLKYQMFGSVDTDTTSESHQPPERLPSTQKVISPSSQEQMCFAALNSVELSHDVNKCRNGKVSQRIVFISSHSIVKKPRSVRVNIGKPHFTRTLPNLSTRSMSIQGLPESAAAFSQRQMQDIESLTVKMMKELKSMKDIIEQKLLSEAYHNVPLRSDADEVKSAVESAKKMEGTAQKWLSKMARDCNRFCKLMKLTPNDVTAPKNVVPRERRNIMFADEAGGKLCDFRFFEDVATSAV